MKSSAFRVGFGFSILVVLTFAGFEGKNLAQQFGVVEKPPVLVFVIPSLENARRVRTAIFEDRIAWQGARKGLP